MCVCGLLSQIVDDTLALSSRWLKGSTRGSVTTPHIAIEHICNSDFYHLMPKLKKSCLIAYPSLTPVDPPLLSVLSKIVILRLPPLCLSYKICLFCRGGQLDK